MRGVAYISDKVTFKAHLKDISLLVLVVSKKTMCLHAAGQGQEVEAGSRAPEVGRLL